MTRMVTMRLETHSSETVSVVSTVTGYFCKSNQDYEIVRVIHNSFSDREICTLRLDSEECKLLTSSGDIMEFSINERYVWENEKEIIVYGMKVNGGDNLIVVRGALNGVFKLSRNTVKIEIGCIPLSVQYEKYYGWHIESTEDSFVQVVDSIPPSVGISDTETVRLGTDGSLEPISYSDGVKEASIENCTNLLQQVP